MRKFMKRAASTALAAAMVFSLAACGQGGGDTTEGTTAGDDASSTTEAAQESDITLYTCLLKYSLIVGNTGSICSGRKSVYSTVI